MSFAIVFAADAQDLEPRAYSNAPVGLNIIAAALVNSRGDIAFDPSLPVEDVKADIYALALTYVRTLDVLGRSAKFGAVLPRVDGDVSGIVFGEPRNARRIGLADVGLVFSVNWFGAPALKPAAFAGYQQKTIVGTTFKVTVPTGEYFDDKVLNIGTNRWSFEAEAGVSHRHGPWTFEFAASGEFFTDNDDHVDGTRAQDPIWATQFHVIRAFHRKIWGALSATYYFGGRTHVNGVEQDDRQNGSRLGAVLSFDVARQHSVKLIWASGLITRVGADFDTLGIAYQYVWGI